jgi:hypothetical protein
VIVEKRQRVHQERPEVLAKGAAADHPLVVVAPAVVVRPIEASPRDCRRKPEEELLVPGVHPKGHVGLAPVTPEVALPDEQPDQEASLKGVEWCESGRRAEPTGGTAFRSRMRRRPFRDR